MRSQSFGRRTRAAQGLEVAVKLSIIICTRDRADLLRLCLDALLGQEGVAADTYEILVVDNGSTDHTKAVVDAARHRFPRIRLLREERLGLSIARNAGVAQACGEIVSFLDDDAVAYPDFVREIVRSLENPEAACVGGRIVATWPDGVPPGWFDPRYGNVVGQTPFGETPRWMKRNEFPFGSNLSLRREIFHRLGGFNEDLGKKGDSSLWGEEIDLCHRMQETGLRFLYNPRLCVNHIVGPARATKRYFVESLFGKGVTEGRQKLAHRGKTVFAAYLLFKACRLAVTSVYYLAVGASLFEATRFRLRCAISWDAGYLHFLAVREDVESTSAAKLRLPSRKSRQTA